MNQNGICPIAPNVHAIGSQDWKRRIFDAFAPTPLGTTYNTYLVKGQSKTALIDTILPSFGDELSSKIDLLLGSHAIDYVIMNHAEPDHAGSIPRILGQSNAVLITTPKGAEFAQSYFKSPPDRIRVVKTDETIDLGGKTLRFLHAPFLHWPETMFTYLPEDKILFSGDFFGSHNPTGWFDDEAEEVLHWARKYYAEIMMPLAKMGRLGMAKIKDLDLALIAPSHGPMYRNPRSILNEYTKWTGEETLAKAVIIYVSMYGTIEKMARALADTLVAEGVSVRLFDLAVTDIGDLAGHLVDTRALVLGTPTVLGAMHPLSMYATYMIKMLRPPVKYGVIMNSYGWGKGAIHQGQQFLDEAKIESVATIEINGTPSLADFEHIHTVGQQLAAKIKAVVSGTT
jgi:flavorubredoxin